MTGLLTAAGKEWLRAARGGAAAPARQRVFLLCGASAAALRARSLSQVLAGHRELAGAIELVDARHRATTLDGVRVRVCLPMPGQSEPPRRIGLFAFDPEVPGEPGRRLYEATVPQASLAPWSVLRLTVQGRSRPLAAAPESRQRRPDAISAGRGRRRPPDLVGRTVLEALAFAEAAGGVRLVPGAAESSQQLGRVIGQQGGVGKLTAVVAVNDHGDLQLLPTIGEATAERLRALDPPVTSLGGFALLSQARCGQLGMPAAAAKHLASLSFHMVLVTGADAAGATAAEIVKRALAWTTRSGAVERIEAHTAISFRRACQRIMAGMVGAGSLSQAFPRETVDSWWRALERLLRRR